MAATAVAAPGSVPAVPAAGAAAAGAATTTSAPSSTSTALASLQSNPQLAGVMAIAARLKDYAANAFAERKPWAEVFDRSSFSKPATLQEATSRLRKNVAYFRVNYAAATVATVALAFLSHPSSLLVLGALVLAWVYVFALHTGPLVINGRTLSDREKFFGMSAASFVLVFFLTGVGSLAFSALVAAGALVAAHGAMRAPDDLFLDEGGDPGAQGGLLAILMGGGGGGSGGAGNV